MQVSKIKQFVFVIGCLVSLLVSPVLSCTCHHGSHEVEKSGHAQPDSSHCHEKKESREVKKEASHSHDDRGKGPHTHHEKEKAPHAHQKTVPAEHHQADETATDKIVCLSFSEQECCCIKPAPEVFAKAEKFKFGNSVIAILPASIIQTEFAPQLVTFNLAPFIKPFYLTDSFYNISPGRAPPRL